MNQTPNAVSTEEAEYYFQELRAQRLRAKLLFLGHVDGDAEEEYGDYDDYGDYPDAGAP